MAFRASRKSSATNDQLQSKASAPISESATPVVAQNVSNLSVDDLVGGPTKRETPEARAVQETPDVPETGGTQEVRNTQGRQDLRGPRQDFGHRQGFSFRSRNFGFRRRDRDFGRGGYFNGPPRSGPRFSESAAAPSYTPDIDVPTETVRGVLDTMPEGHGFLRPKYTPSERDIYISQSQIRRFLLRNGDMVEGQAREPKDNERYWGLLRVEKVNELAADQVSRRPKFEDLTPVYPNKQLRLETAAAPLSTRIIDLVAPIGFGQRGLVVSPPKAGKTTILKEIAAGISANYPTVHLMAALIGERPEEVTDISRSVKGEVFASNFDESPPEQTRIAEVALDRAKRLVEMGKDVVILLDSITRLARAYNLVVNPSGRTLSGGFDPAALYPAKRFLGAARCVELAVGETQTPGNGSVTGGGSLTVIGTALVETGSRMDDLIYEEFKGTGNMELHLSRALQERRVFPAIDIARSGTRHDELLLGEEAMKKITTLRHMLSLLSDEERTVMLVDRLSKTKTNAEFLESLGKG